MTKRVAIIFKMMLIIGMIGLISCGEKAPPAPASNVVKKKIVVPSTPEPKANPAPAEAPAVSAAQTAQPAAPPAVPPQTAASPVERGPEAAPMTDRAPSAAAPTVETAAAAAPPAMAPGDSPGQAATDGDPGLTSAQAQAAGSYNPQGRFDPFAPLFKEQALPEAAPAPKGKRQKRVPQTPLEKVALSQLKLSAIIRSSSGNRALVADASGKGYVVQLGTYIGLNSGKVIQIERDRIVIEEEIEDLMGEIKVQNSELKLQKPAGEF